MCITPFSGCIWLNTDCVLKLHLEFITAQKSAIAAYLFVRVLHSDWATSKHVIYKNNLNLKRWKSGI